MKKKIIRMFWLFALLSIVSAVCFSAPQAQPTKITLWSNDRHDMDYMNKVVAAYNNNNKDNIKLELVIQADNLDQMLKLAASSKQSPDLFVFNMPEMAEKYVESNLMLPQNKYITAKLKRKIGLESLLCEGYNLFNGQIYYIPTVAKSGRRLIYNKDLFKKAGINKPPVTVDEMVNDAIKITKVGEGKAFGFVLPGMGGHLGRIITSCAEMSGVKEYDFKTGKFAFDGFKPFILAVKKIIESGAMMPGYISMKIDPLRVQFAEGNIGMYGNASQEVGVLNQQFPAKCDWGAAPPPTSNGKVKGALTYSFVRGFCISPQSKNPDQAWKVIEYLMSDEVMIGYVQGGYGMPTFKNIASKAQIPAGMKGFKDFLQLSYERIYPPLPSVQVEGKIWQDALWEACIPGGPNVDDVISKLNTNYNKALDKAVQQGSTKRLIISNYDPLNPGKGAWEYKTN